MDFEFANTGISGIVLARSKRSIDERGTFIKGYEPKPFSSIIQTNFVEDYVSISSKSVIRGLHYQVKPKTQGKLITVVSGKIYDVAIDLRRDSSAFGQYVSNELSSFGIDTIWISPGFAHGFLSLVDNTIILTRCTNEFSPETERGIRWNDPNFRIKWPTRSPILSSKDGKWPYLPDISQYGIS